MNKYVVGTAMWLCVALTVATLVTWVRYAVLRFGEDEGTPRLLTPAVTTASLVVATVVLVILDPSL